MTSTVSTSGPPDRQAPRFWCPGCHAGWLENDTTAMTCAACAHRFVIRRGVPVLIVDERSVFAQADFTETADYQGASFGTKYDASRGLRASYRRFMHFLRESGPRYKGLTSGEALRRVCAERPRPRVLVIGAGAVRFEVSADITYTDVSFSEGIACIADAHDLPFADGSFDMVVAVAVLEHVVDPQRVEREMRRVLVDDGWVYAATPFLQPVHMGAHDFTRFTALGHRRLFRHFAEIESGISPGPGWVLGAAIRSLLRSFGGGVMSNRILNLAGILLAFPWRWIDVWTLHRPIASDGAGGVHFFGRRSETPLSDRELIGLYRGGG